MPEGGAGAFAALVAVHRQIGEGVGVVIAKRFELGVTGVAASLAGVASLTLDPTERHGFEYQSWLGFSIFAAGVRGEIGRGGSYAVVHEDGREEAAVGFSLYADPILDAGLGADSRRRLFLPFGTPAERGAALRAEGWVTVAALEAEDNPAAQLCSHVLGSEGPEAV